MPKLPNPKSYQQILGEMLSTYMAKIGVNDLTPGSAVTSFFEAMAQAVYRSSGDTFAILRDFSVDRAEGEALKRIATEENISLTPARVATGLITITDSSFVKIATKIYAGTTPPNIGSTTINVSDASAFTQTGPAPQGQLYIGRNTPNIEGPISYDSISLVGGFYEITLSTPTTKYHNINESVVLSQGGVRNIAVGTIAKTDGSGSSTAVSFSTTKAATILDGENEVVGVSVAALNPSTDGNIPANAIKSFETEPFVGATVRNPSPYTTGLNSQTDDEIRIAIKKARISRGLGTVLAIKNAVQGAQASDENETIVSNEIFSDGNSTVLFIDNGRAYEESFSGVGLESIVDSALGGEVFFQISTGGSQTSTVKAFLESSISSPFSINPTDRLAVLVGGILSEHVFAEGNFRSNGFATAFEVAASINGNSNLLYSARTINDGKNITISSKEEDNEFIQKTIPTTGTDAGLALGFSSNESETIKLYKNNVPLSRNGRSAVIESENQSDWANTIATNDTLLVSVDNTSEVAYVFTNADFAAEGTHQTVAKTNTLQSWINVINSKITGITASINGNRIVITSNLGNNSRASVVVNITSTLVSKGMFTSVQGLSASGREADFIFSRNTNQLKLTTPLSAGDSLTAGSEFTQGLVKSTPILGGSVSFSSEAYLWAVIDDNNATIQTHGVTADSQIHLTKPGGNIIRFRSALSNAFGNVQVGDYVVIWSEELLAANRIEGRVLNVGSQLETNDFFEIKVTATEYAATTAQTPITFSEGLAFVRTLFTPQKIRIAAGSYNINTVANLITSQTVGASAKVENDEIITISTDDKSEKGGVLIVTFNDVAKNLNITIGSSGASVFSHFGFFSSATAQFPLFVHSSFSDERSADTPVSSIPDFESAVDLISLGIDPNEIICMQDPYLSDGISFKRDGQSTDECVQIDDLLPANIVDIDYNPFIRRTRLNDRFYMLSSLDFDFNDDITVILNGDAVNNTFPINLYRRGVTNTTQPINSDEFRAYDIDAGATTEFSEFFGTSYDFKNYRVMMKARNGIDPNSLTDEDAIFYRSSQWGKAGNNYDVGYTYPTSANQSISHVVTVTDKVRVRVSLKSGGPVANTIDGTTEWDVSVTPNTPVAGVDEVSYTHNLTGTVPGMSALVPGDYVNINGNGEFSIENQGTFRVSSSTASSFTVRRPNGAATVESGVASLTVNTIALYEDSDTSATEIVDYVSDNLSDWITSELLDDNGTTGAGVINLSTHEDNNFAVNAESVALVDGINWVKSSDLGAISPDPQFTLKRTLQLPFFDTNTVESYSFNSGEDVRVIPTTMVQLQNFVNILAVTGVTTLSSVSTSQRDSELQIATDILGSGGTVNVSGGTGNTAQAQIVSTASKVFGSNNLMKSTITKSSSGGINVGSWLKLTASFLQRKITGISATTQVTVTPNLPIPTTSIIELSNRDVADRYFGQPSNFFRSRGRAIHIEKHGSLVNISWDEVTGANPVFSKNVEFNDAVGGAMSVSFNGDFLTTEFNITSGARNFSEVNVGDIVVVQNFSDAVNNGIFIVRGISDDKTILSVDNPNGVSATAAAVSVGDLVITTTVGEGDTVEIGSPFNSLNQGIYRVIRKYENSIYIDNTAVVEERVVVPDNFRDLGFDATTQFNVTTPGNMRIEWNTSGTQPTLANARMGDSLTIGTSFAVSNQGVFMIADSGDNYIEVAHSKAIVESNVTVNNVGNNVLQSQISAILFSPYENTRAGDSFVISGNVLGENNQGTYTVTEALSKTRIVVSSLLAGTYASFSGQVSGLTTNIVITANNTGAAGNITLVADSIKDVDTLISDFNIANPNNTVSLSSGSGAQVPTSNIVLSGGSISLGVLSNQIFSQEGIVYTGYKKVFNKAIDPANNQRTTLIFDSNNQVEKITEAGSILISAQNKLGFSQEITPGFDSYKFHTGLIREANKITYGDPSDSTTYPGVSAAGAEIFIQSPLVRRIEVSINVRVNTGIPFARITEQVRNNIAALVNSTAIGVSIAISDIISSVNSIPGTRAISITFPEFTPQNDIIVINAAEKPLILDIVNDISVSKVT